MLFLALLVVCCILVSAMGFVPWSARSTRSYRMGWFGSDGKDGSDFKEADVKSKEIERLMAKIETTQNEIISTISQQEKDEATLKELDSEFGEEIARVKKEFARMKERSYEEAQAETKEAKAKALASIIAPLVFGVLWRNMSDTAPWVIYIVAGVSASLSFLCALGVPEMPGDVKNAGRPSSASRPLEDPLLG